MSISDTDNQDFVSGYDQTSYVPWTSVVSRRGDITAFTNWPLTSAMTNQRGQIYVKSPGVYLINGFVQFKNVTAEIAGMNVFATVNRGVMTNASNIDPVKDGGVPFTFCLFVSELDINSEDTAIGKTKGTAALSVAASYDKGSTSLNTLKLVSDDARYVWCMVTHLG